MVLDRFRLRLIRNRLRLLVRNGFWWWRLVCSNGLRSNRGLVNGLNVLLHILVDFLFLHVLVLAAAAAGRAKEDHGEKEAEEGCPGETIAVAAKSGVVAVVLECVTGSDGPSAVGIMTD